jgi:hypothetical protein
VIGINAPGHRSNCPAVRMGITCLSFSPDNVQETGVWPRWTVWIPHRGRRGGAGRANSKKDLVTGPIRGLCALQARQRGQARAHPPACDRDGGRGGRDGRLKAVGCGRGLVWGQGVEGGRAADPHTQTFDAGTCWAVSSTSTPLRREFLYPTWSRPSAWSPKGTTGNRAP